MFFGKGSFEIFSHVNLPEFKAGMMNEKEISVNVASIGVPHNESIVIRSTSENVYRRSFKGRD